MDKEWEVLELLLPKPRNPGRPRKYPLREIPNGIFYVLRSGCSWRIMSKDLLHWKTVYHYFRVRVVYRYSREVMEWARGRSFILPQTTEAWIYFAMTS